MALQNTRQLATFLGLDPQVASFGRAEIVSIQPWYVHLWQSDHNNMSVPFPDSLLNSVGHQVSRLFPSKQREHRSPTDDCDGLSSDI